MSKVRIDSNYDVLKRQETTVSSSYLDYFEQWDNSEMEECRACYGTGMDRDEIYECPVCGGEGEVPVEFPLDRAA